MFSSSKKHDKGRIVIELFYLPHPSPSRDRSFSWERAWIFDEVDGSSGRSIGVYLQSFVVCRRSMMIIRLFTLHSHSFIDSTLKSLQWTWDASLDSLLIETGVERCALLGLIDIRATSSWWDWFVTISCTDQCPCQIVLDTYERIIFIISKTKEDETVHVHLTIKLIFILSIQEV